MNTTRKVKGGFVVARRNGSGPPSDEAPRPSDEAHIVTDVTEALTRRLTAGRAVYGPLVLATDTRDFVEEAWEEGIDLLVYLAAARRVRDGLRAEVERLREERDETLEALRQKTEEIKRSVELNCQLQTEVTCLEHAVDAARMEADNLRASTAVLMRERDEARRLYCDEWPCTATVRALRHGWVGLYPAPANGPEKTDGRCTFFGEFSKVVQPCSVNENGCGDCPHFEPEEEP
jgi:hypothetical protein